LKGAKGMTTSNAALTLEAPHKTTLTKPNKLSLLFALAIINGLLLKFAINQGALLIAEINYRLISMN
jgi:hypothetical protein